MKNMGMTKLLAIILILAGYFTASAQLDYIVLVHGDTLAGKVVFLNYHSDHKVQLTDKNNVKKTYTLLQVKAFKSNNNVYHLVRRPDQYVFMRVLQSGYLSLYAFQMDGQDTWNGRYLLKKDGNGQEVPTIGFKRRLYEFLYECPEVTNEIAEGNLNRGDLEEIINQYNLCIENRTNLKYRNQSQSKISPEVKGMNEWSNLEKAISNADISDKESILEMVSDARSKIERSEKLPKFLLDGLKKSLAGNQELSELLTLALTEIGE